GVDLETLCKAIAAMTTATGLESNAFFALRFAYLNQVIQPFLKEEVDLPWMKVVSVVWELTSDQELIEQLVERWQAGQSIQAISDFPQQHKILSKENRPLLRLLREPLDSPVEFMNKIKRAYFDATSEKKDVTLSVTFKSNGSWSVQPGLIRRVESDLLSEQCLQGDFNPPKTVLKNSLEELFYLTWVRKLREDEPEFKASSLNDWLGSTLIDQHICRDEFLARCLYCGRKDDKPRKNKRFCQTSSNHRAAFKKWIDRIQGKDPIDIEGLFLNRLDQIKSELNS
ncbi:MAG: hypothetical protein K8F91_05170, partial [Candidatus Obscuribacterales bacterium]|nr:hypothetical protein [Candidatus Obscuribacterales bacterium]